MENKQTITVLMPVPRAYQFEYKGLHLFAHHEYCSLTNGWGKRWRVSEKDTGYYVVSSYSTKKEAITNAKKHIDGKPEEQIKDIKEFIISHKALRKSLGRFAKHLT